MLRIGYILATYTIEINKINDIIGIRILSVAYLQIYFWGLRGVS